MRPTKWALPCVRPWQVRSRMWLQLARLLGSLCMHTLGSHQNQGAVIPHPCPPPAVVDNKTGEAKEEHRFPVRGTVMVEGPPTSQTLY